VKLLAIGRPPAAADVSQIGRHAAAEMRAPWQLYREGVVREMYSPGRPGAVLVLEASTKTEAETAVAGLPLAAAGLIGFEVIELHPFGAFEVLFGNQPQRAGAREGEASA
jgi:hypothetical protein